MPYMVRLVGVYVHVSPSSITILSPFDVTFNTLYVKYICLIKASKEHYTKASRLLSMYTLGGIQASVVSVVYLDKLLG